MIATHENGYTGELRGDGTLFIKNQEGDKVLHAEECGGSSEEYLLSILGDIPSFLEGIRMIEEGDGEAREC